MKGIVQVRFTMQLISYATIDHNTKKVCNLMTLQ